MILKKNQMRKSPGFTPPDMAERHATVDRFIESTAETLRVPEVSRELGGHALYLEEALGRLYVPNVGDGFIVWEWDKDDSIPIVAVKPFETFDRFYKYCEPSQRQQRAAGDELSDEEKSIIFRQDRTLYLPNPNVAARVDHRLIPTKINGRTRLRLTRPFILLNLNQCSNKKDESVISPSLLPHELTHCVQYEIVPSYTVEGDCEEEEPPAELFSKELEAYHVGAAVIRGLDAAGKYGDLSNADMISLDVDSERRKTNSPEDPWRSSEVLARKVYRRGHGYVLTGVKTTRSVFGETASRKKQWREFDTPTTSRLRFERINSGEFATEE